MWVRRCRRGRPGRDPDAVLDLLPGPAGVLVRQVSPVSRLWPLSIRLIVVLVVQSELSRMVAGHLDRGLIAGERATVGGGVVDQGAVRHVPGLFVGVAGVQVGGATCATGVVVGERARRDHQRRERGRHPTAERGAIAGERAARNGQRSAAVARESTAGAVARDAVVGHGAVSDGQRSKVKIPPPSGSRRVVRYNAAGDRATPGADSAARREGAGCHAGLVADDGAVEHE